MEASKGGAGSDVASVRDRRSGPGRIAGRAARSFGYAALVTPIGLLTLATVPFVGPDPAARRWQRLASRILGQPSATAHHPSRVRMLGHALISVALGLVSWVIITAIVLVAVRGGLYGLVDRGPYDTSWGGPSLAGAWLTHAALSTAGVVVGLFILHGLVLLHGRLTGWIYGTATHWWLLPVAAILCIAGEFVIAFIHQF